MTRRRNPSKSKSYDWVALTVLISLMCIGWFMVFSTLYVENEPFAFLNPTTQIGAQTLWVVIALFAIPLILTIDWKFWFTLAFPVYAFTIILLLLVLVFGKEIHGAKAWFSIGPFSFQPSEWAKFGTALALASYLSFFKSSITARNTFIISIALFLGPALIIMLQPDFGSALVFTSFFILLYRKGMSPWVLIFGIGFSAIFIFSMIYSPIIVTAFLIFIGTLFLLFELDAGRRDVMISILTLLVMIFLILQKEYQLLLVVALMIFAIYFVLNLKEKNFKIIGLVIPLLIAMISFSYGTTYVFDKLLKPHQQDRINVWLRPDKCDPQGSLYNLIQSKMAIGSGGFQGKGFLKGEMTKLNYVPEQSTDFIFTTIGEEQGFIGVIGVVLLYTILLLRCIVIAERANLEFIRNYGYAVAGILFFHFFFNIGMTMGLLPVVGIPLPFLSKGGSSLIAFTLMIAVLIKMDMARLRSL
ncbi:MAG: rod shape-determining protein RodA [Saprospiraceae bacterium]|nr:rod shape-determining protein RodA [Saprospiraceae bacterium]